MKACSLCKKAKETQDFSRPYKKLTALYARCKVCRAHVAREARLKPERNWRNRLRRCYRTTPEVVMAMFDSQNGCCAVCGEQKGINTGKTFGSLHIDHDHLSGKIRGLLCYDCNLGLGRFKDSIERLLSAALYLERQCQK